jgi:selenocysteine lyase/cysteine desulfurase
MLRRNFLGVTGAVLGIGSLRSGDSIAADLSAVGELAKAPNTQTKAVKQGDWTALRDLFPLTRDYIQLSTFLLASHPKPVSDEINRHRIGLDENPSDYWHDRFQTIDAKISASAARYMGGKGAQIALTDSTTMGLALVYSGLKLRPGQEILQTTHDHYSTDLSLAQRAKRTGATVRRVSLYTEPATVSEQSIVDELKQAISAKTAVVAITWVHSSTGVKLPVRAMADAIADINQQREEGDQILFCVDGVHGFGIEDQDVSKLGCDFFIAGTHKWIFGPRGTGVIWGNDRAWAQSEALIPSFGASYGVWLGELTPDQVATGDHMTPGGFHSFEHRWSLPAAFDLHMQLGKDKVQQRIHQLNTQTKDGLAKMAHVKLYTPKSTGLSSGLTCFDVDGVEAETVVKRMHDKGIIMSSTPYRQSYARFAPSLINNENEIESALAEIRAMA